MQTTDTEAQHESLIERHQQLDDEADQLSARRILTPNEQLQLKVLKVERLMARERLDKFRILHDLTMKSRKE